MLRVNLPATSSSRLCTVVLLAAQSPATSHPGARTQVAASLNALIPMLDMDFDLAEIHTEVSMYHSKSDAVENLRHWHTLLGPNVPFAIPGH